MVLNNYRGYVNMIADVLQKIEFILHYFRLFLKQEIRIFYGMVNIENKIQNWGEDLTCGM